MLLLGTLGNIDPEELDGQGPGHRYSKRLMQQDSVESLQSDRKSLEEELSLLDIGRYTSDSVAQIVYYYCYYLSSSSSSYAYACDVIGALQTWTSAARGRVITEEGVRTVSTDIPARVRPDTPASSADEVCTRTFLRFLLTAFVFRLGNFTSIKEGMFHLVFVSVCVRGTCDDALYKLMFYLLTYFVC